MNTDLYHGWDVHSYSSSWAQEAAKHSRLLTELVSEADFANLIQDISNHYNENLPVINMFRQTYRRGGNQDPDLSNVNVAKLLLVTWEKVKELSEPTIFTGFKEVLNDIGETCLQGRSHRLFSYWIALTRT